ncbi:MAG: beta-lactamase family protein [Actinobacteria bacterium]|nr:beta-lactamase family protein [Actinomycetota bacterium]
MSRIISAKRSGVLVATVLFLTILPVLLSSCGSPCITSEKRSAIEGEVDAIIADNGIPGAILGIWTPCEEPLILNRGTADIKTGSPMEDFLKVRIGSNTKTFTITVLLQLVDEGKIKLNDTLDKYVQEVPNAVNITIKQLCNMTSGLYNYLESEEFQQAMAEDPKRKWEPSELLGYAVSEKPYFPPGKGFHYSNTNTILAGMIIEEVTGNAAGEEITRRLIEPLGLEKTVFPVNPDLTGSHSRGYTPDEENKELEDVTDDFDPSWAWTAGAMISNLYDLKPWVEALGNGKFLSDATQKKRLAWTNAKLGDINLGYGLGIMSVDGFLGHAGDLPGYSSAAFYSPEKDTAIIVLLNMEPCDKPAIALRVFMAISDILYPK